MKSILILVLFFIIGGCSNPRKGSSTNSTQIQNGSEIKLIGKNFQDRKGLTFKVLQEISFDFNNDGLSDKIKIEKITSSISSKDSTVHKWTDPGDFHKLIIFIANGDSLELLNVNGWLKNEAFEYYLPDFTTSNLIKSPYITVLKNDSKNMIFCKGCYYASKPGLLTIISCIDNKPKMIFNDEAYLFEYKDLNNDGISDIITTQFDKDNIIGKKEPYKVYLLNNGFTYDDKLSKQFVVDNSNN